MADEDSRRPFRVDAGQFHVTLKAKAELGAEEIRDAKERHLRGEWGSVPADLARQNELNLRKKKGRLVSLHQARNGLFFHVVTDPTLGRTTFVFEDEVDVSGDGQVTWRSG